MKPCLRIAAGAFLLSISTAAAAQSQAPLVPQPFPGSSPARQSEPAPPAPNAPATQPPAPPTVVATELPPVATAVATDAPQGLPVYPTAEFIDGFDAGSGQRYYLYGTDIPFEEIVAYYRNLMKNGGRELFRDPPTRQWDLGRYQESSMAYPPSVVVKDYTWNGSPGYLAVSGTTEKRYKTVIQIVPVSAAR
jgi:hypothetical protein